jgi:ABC-type glycerol-3-phosphate transport system substrate-binding protein
VPRFGYLLLGMEFNAWPFTPWIWSAGGELVRPNPDGTYRVAFNEEPGVDVAELWNQMIWQYRMTQRDVLKNWSDYTDDMQAGRGVFGFGQIEYYSSDAMSKYGIPPETFGIMPMPAKDSRTKQTALAGGEVWVFSPRASDAQTRAAFDFAVLASYDKDMLERRWAHQNTISSITSTIPGRTDMIDVKFNKYGTAWPRGWAEDFAALSQFARLEPFCLNWDNLKNILAPHLQEILLKEGITRTEIKSILDRAADECYSSYPAAFKR